MTASFDGGLTVRTLTPFPNPSSNRTCRSPASGSRAKSHAFTFTHGWSLPRAVKRTLAWCQVSPAISKYLPVASDQSVATFDQCRQADHCDDYPQFPGCSLRGLLDERCQRSETCSGAGRGNPFPATCLRRVTCVGDVHRREDQQKTGASQCGDAGQVKCIGHDQGCASADQQPRDRLTPNVAFQQARQFVSLRDAIAQARGTVECGVNRGRGEPAR